ncbi:hypothetical protein Pcinc_006912 [Petrolisthes cinctipes]|uniref:Uncharacterized protein n=1 Tax=Petrolisthes cinctipes TaxID=88211 RepID=A0AAE1GBZ3_PETCI|nr:hypothetical protein Pcinc_006912 [Petrolisthes cinctipes]
MGCRRGKQAPLHPPATWFVELQWSVPPVGDGFLMERAHPPYCDDCLVPLTVRHLIVECPSLEDLRRRHLSEYRVGDGSYSLSQVLGEEACSVGKNTLSYVEEAGLLHKI